MKTMSADLLQAAAKQVADASTDRDIILDYVRRAKRKQRKFVYVTKQMGDEIDREVALKACVREFIIHIACLICTAVFGGSAHTRDSYFTKVGLNTPITTTQFATNSNYTIAFGKIYDIGDIWHFYEEIVYNLLYNDVYYHHDEPIAPIKLAGRSILFSNTMLGVPRLRQVRQKSDSCEIDPATKFMASTCFSSELAEHIDKKPFGLAQPTAWVYSSAEKTKSLPCEGEFAEYEGGGYYLDLSSEGNASFYLLMGLKNNTWITRETRAVFLDVSFYNNNVNQLAHLRILFEISLAGDVLGKFRVNCLEVLLYESISFYVLGGILILFMIYFIFEEGMEFYYFKWRYFIQLWTYIDLLMITLTFLSIGTFCLTAWELRKFPTTIKSKEYVSVEKFMSWQLLQSRVIAWTILVQYMRVFKYLGVNKSMGQLNQTMVQCSFELLSFMVMFFIVFCSYADIGQILFGEEADDYHGFPMALLSLFRTILGDFDYDILKKANRSWSAIYFISFILLVFFVLLNMFLAIINDAYTEVKTEIAIAPDQVQISDYLKSICGKFCCRKQEMKQINQYEAAIDDIKNTLAKCGYTDMETQMFFTRYNIDPYAKTRDMSRGDVLNSLENEGLKAEASRSKVVRPQEFFARLDWLEEIEGKLQKVVASMNALTKRIDDSIVGA